MPSFAVHLAIANEVIRKNNNNICNKKDFIFASISPDMENDKIKSHYHMIEKYMINGINSDYDKGYFLHVLTDYEFYLNDFKKEYFINDNEDINERNNFYKDYSILAPYIIEKYKIKNYPKSIEKFMIGINGRLEFIKLEKLDLFINKISEINLEEKREELIRDNFKEKFYL